MRKLELHWQILIAILLAGLSGWLVNRSIAAGTPDPSILGVSILGEGASELVHIGQAVIAMGGTIDYFVDTVFNYPTLAECYKTAAFDGINRLALGSMELEVPDRGDWQERTLAWMYSLRRELHAHPAVAPLLRLRGSLAPALQGMDSVSATLTSAVPGDGA